MVFFSFCLFFMLFVSETPGTRFQSMILPKKTRRIDLVSIFSLLFVSQKAIFRNIIDQR